MSLDRPSGAPSPRPDGGEQGLAEVLRDRGAPLLEALERHSLGAREHADATASYAFAAAVELGFERSQCEVAREAAALHEVGLVYVPAEVIAKPAAERDPAERAAYDRHFEAGSRLALGAGIPEHACAWILRARERFDGAGPEGLAGDGIPFESRLIRAACACQTALGGASEQAAADLAAIGALNSEAGGALDPRVATALVAVLERIAAR